MHTYTYTHIYEFTGIHIQTYTHTYTYVRIRIHTHKYTYTNLQTCAYIQRHTCHTLHTLQAFHTQQAVQAVCGDNRRYTVFQTLCSLHALHAWHKICCIRTQTIAYGLLHTSNYMDPCISHLEPFTSSGIGSASGGGGCAGSPGEHGCYQHVPHCSMLADPRSIDKLHTRLECQ